jgi:hypothetical protein
LFLGTRNLRGVKTVFKRMIFEASNWRGLLDKIPKKGS